MLRSIEELLAELTLEEKVQLLGGSDSWHAAGVERLGIPDLKITDGSNGARGATMSNGPRSACFPCGTAVGATWDVELVRRVGIATAEEVKLKGARMLLAPTVNMHRTPLAGRNLECYSEDPFLSARMAVGHIEGVQGEGLAACVKHLVANDQEFERLTISAEVDERTLREIYLPPFEAAITEARAWSIMSSYNRVNGVYASEHPWLLTTVLRDEWGFDGPVVSDWGGTHSTAAAINAGLDCEMPGPPKWFGTKLLDAVKAGEVSEETLDAAVRRMLLVRERTGLLEPGWIEPEEAEDDRPEHRALIRETAASAIVLLRNDGVLPLDAASLRTVAVIGPNAAVARIQGGGSPAVRPHPAQSPLDAIIERLGDGVEVVFEPGADVQRGIPRMQIHLTAEYFVGETFEGTPTGTDSSDGGGSWWYNADVPGWEPGGTFSARLSGSFVPETSGPHQFSIQSRGVTRLFVDDVECIDNWTSQEPDTTDVWGTAVQTGTVELRAGERVDVRIEFASRHPKSGGVVIGMRTPVPADSVARAAAAARDADVAIIVAGLSADYESETFDRETMALAGNQD
jgi:beta-glucosidase